MVQFFSITGFVNAVFALGFGLIIILKDWHSRVNRLFFFMTFSVAFWSAAYWRWLASPDAEAAFFWVRLLSIGSLFIPVFYFHWVLALLEIRNRFMRWVLWISYSFAAITLFFVASPHFVKTVRPILDFPFWPIGGALYSAYILVIYIGLVSTGLWYLIRTHQTVASPVLRQQIRYVIVGTVLGFGGGLTNFFLWYDILIPPFGNILVVLFPFFLGYATLKHNLFNLKVIATELLVAALWMFLLVRIILSVDQTQRFIDGGLLTVLVVFGILLIRSVHQEVKSREKIESLAIELSGANEELKRLDEAKSEFISIAGHQLRTPLTVIKGYTSMLLEGSFGTFPEKGREALDRVLISATTLAKLVTDLLDLSRIEAGRIRYDMKEMKLEDVVYGVVKELEETAKSRGIALMFKNENAAGTTVFADFEKMHEVVINVVDNAVKYGQANSSVDIRFRPENGSLLLTVTDHGMGIKAEDIPKLFIKFARSDEARKIRPDGMGLGLYLAKKIVEDHKGRAWVESAGLGKGSTFYVELPLH